MKFGLVFALSLFIISSTFIYPSYGCGSSQWSFRAGQKIPFNHHLHDSCLGDSCVQFKCIIEDDVIIQGGTCFRNFFDICRYVPTKLKETLEKNKMDFAFADSSLIFASKNAENGGEEQYEKYIKLNPDVENKFAAHIKTRWDGKTNVSWTDKFTEPRKILSQVHCGVKQSCKAGSLYDKSPVDILQYTTTKTCNACFSYMCTVDGKQIMYGSGCFEDFNVACGNIAATEKDFVYKNLKNSFHYGKNFVVASCSHGDSCAEIELQRYTSINREAYETFTNNIDKSYGQSCEYRPLTEQEQINHDAAVFEAQNSSSNASLNVYLFWMIISGFILFHRW